MGTNRDSIDWTALSEAEIEWLETVQELESLAALRDVIGGETEHEAYLTAKEQWKHLRARAATSTDTGVIPGRSVPVGDRTVVVHGITHADTTEEGAFLRDGVETYLADGDEIYCEQGIRPMYFQDMDAVCEIDDYRWAMYHCREQDIDSHIPGEIEREFNRNNSVRADIRTVARQFRKETFSLIDRGSAVYGHQFGAALGDVASDFLTSHEELGTGENFDSFKLSEEAARNPASLESLQQYYESVFLPQPIEREWLRRHDPELELFTHARNERIAAYSLAQAPAATTVHVITGAAHQPGVTYYVRAYRDGDWDYDPFEEMV
jgi:hypothetical protein